MDSYFCSALYGPSSGFYFEKSAVILTVLFKLSVFSFWLVSSSSLCLWMFFHFTTTCLGLDLSLIILLRMCYTSWICGYSSVFVIISGIFLISPLLHSLSSLFSKLQLDTRPSYSFFVSNFSFIFSMFLYFFVAFWINSLSMCLIFCFIHWMWFSFQWLHFSFLEFQFVCYSNLFVIFVGFFAVNLSL